MGETCGKCGQFIIDDGARVLCDDCAENLVIAFRDRIDKLIFDYNAAELHYLLESKTFVMAKFLFADRLIYLERENKR